MYRYERNVEREKEMRNHMVPKKDTERNEPDRNSERLAEGTMVSWVSRNPQSLIPIHQMVNLPCFLSVQLDSSDFA